MRKDIVVFDVATTGLQVLQDEIIEFAALRIRDGKIQASCHFLVLPEQEITSKILRLTDLKLEEFEGASQLYEHSLEIQEFFKDAILVGHRVTFLLSILERKLNIHFQQPHWDTLELTRIFFPTIHDYQLSYLTEKLSLTLEEEDGGHRSEMNARLTWKLYEACRKKGLEFDLSFFDQAKGLLEGWDGRGFIEELHKEIARSFPDRQIRTDRKSVV